MSDETEAPDGTTADTSLDPAEAFLIPAHEIRVGILQALWQAENHSLPFADLRKAVGVRDTGKFTYHLSKLEDRYVAHVDDRYELLYPGHRIVDAIQSGVFDRRVAERSIPLPEPCPDCGERLAFTYEEFIARIRCRNCEETVLGYPFDPGGFTHDEESAVVRAFDRRTRRYWLTATDGVCPVCAGPCDVDLVDEASTLQALERYDQHYASDHPVLVATTCQHCSFYTYVSVGVLALDHPQVVGALADAGVDVGERRLWALDFVVDSACVSLVATDPREVVVTADVGSALDTAAPRVTVDGAADIVDVDLPET